MIINKLILIFHKLMRQLININKLNLKKLGQEISSKNKIIIKSYKRKRRDNLLETKNYVGSQNVILTQNLQHLKYFNQSDH